MSGRGRCRTSVAGLGTSVVAAAAIIGAASGTTYASANIVPASSSQVLESSTLAGRGHFDDGDSKHNKHSKSDDSNDEAASSDGTSADSTQNGVGQLPVTDSRSAPRVSVWKDSGSTSLSSGQAGSLSQTHVPAANQPSTAGVGIPAGCVQIDFNHLKCGQLPTRNQTPEELRSSNSQYNSQLAQQNINISNSQTQTMRDTIRGCGYNAIYPGC